MISLATSTMSFLRNELTTRPSRNAATISSSFRTFVLRITPLLDELFVLSKNIPGNDQTSPSSKNTRMSKHRRSSGLVLTSYLAKFGFARLLRHIGQQLTSPNQRLKLHEDGGMMWSAWWKVEVYWFPTNVTSTKLTNYLSFRYGAIWALSLFFCCIEEHLICQPWGLQ